MIQRISLAERLIASGTSREREKAAVLRGQIAGAFGSDQMRARELHLYADAVATRLALTLAESHGRSLAAQLVRCFGDHVIAALAQAEVDRSQEVPIAFIDLICAKTGRRAFSAYGMRDPIEPVDGFVTERCITTNLSYVIRSTRSAAARSGLAGYNDAFMYAPTSPEYAQVMRAYVDAELPDLIEERALHKVEVMARRAGAQGRAVVLGSSPMLPRSAAA
jgi:hypothetical protein